MSPNDKLIAVSDYRGYIHVFDMVKLKLLYSVLIQYGDTVLDMAFSNDSKNIVLGFERTLVFNHEQQKVIKELNGHTIKCVWVARSACGKYIITASRAESIVWETKNFTNVITI